MLKQDLKVKHHWKRSVQPGKGDNRTSQFLWGLGLCPAFRHAGAESICRKSHNIKLRRGFPSVSPSHLLCKKCQSPSLSVNTARIFSPGCQSKEEKCLGQEARTAKVLLLCLLQSFGLLFCCDPEPWDLLYCIYWAGHNMLSCSHILVYCGFL